jgi:hypothetical protein
MTYELLSERGWGTRSPFSTAPVFVRPIHIANILGWQTTKQNTMAVLAARLRAFETRAA